MRTPIGFHTPHVDSRLYNDAGLIRHPLQRNIAPSPFSLLRWANFAAFASQYLAKRIQIQNPPTQIINHKAPPV